MQIEFKSNIRGRDLIEVSKKRSIRSQLMDIERHFMNRGFKIFGDIYWTEEDRWAGEYVAVYMKEEIRYNIVA
jgi:hypothetical protein